jgi:hypothetical protein
VAPVYKFSNVGGFTSKTFYTSILAGNPKFEGDIGSIFPLGEFTLASAQSSVDFTNIPQTYTHLQLRYVARDNRSGTFSDDIFIRFNNDSTTANYNSHRLYGSGSGTPSSDRVTGYAGVLSAFVGGATTGTDIFGSGITDILDYKNTNKNKISRSIGGIDNNGSGFSCLISGLWMSTTAINRITIYPLNGTTFDAKSNFALYGVLA